MRRHTLITQLTALAIITIATLAILALLGRWSIIPLPRPIERLIGIAKPATTPSPTQAPATLPHTPPTSPSTAIKPVPPSHFIIAPGIVIAPPRSQSVDQRLFLRPLPALLAPPPGSSADPALKHALAGLAGDQDSWSTPSAHPRSATIPAQPPVALLTAPLLPLPTDLASAQTLWQLQLPSIDARHEASLHGEIPTDLRAILGDSSLRTRDQIDLYAADLALPLLQPAPGASGLSLSVLAGLRIALTDPSRESQSPESGYLPLLGPGLAYHWSRNSSTSISVLADVNQPMATVPEFRVTHTWRLSPASTLSIGYTHLDASFDTSPAPLTLKRDAATILFSLDF